MRNMMLGLRGLGAEVVEYITDHPDGLDEDQLRSAAAIALEKLYGISEHIGGWSRYDAAHRQIGDWNAPLS
jgi:hypothetical protein